MFAGLTPLTSRLAEVGTFATRFPGAPADLLGSEECALALTLPAEEQGVTYTQEAVDLAVEFAKGIPYHLQLIGQEIWEAGETKEISAAVVKQAIPRALTELENSMYKPLWDKASASEKSYLVMMANYCVWGQAVAVSQINQGLRKTNSQLGTVRQRLIDKGLIHGSGHGMVEFSYPNFAEYITKIQH